MGSTLADGLRDEAGRTSGGAEVTAEAPRRGDTRLPSSMSAGQTTVADPRRQVLPLLSPEATTAFLEATTAFQEA